MSTRDDLHRLVDQLPEREVRNVGDFLTSILNPRPKPPHIEELHNRAAEYRKQVEERFWQTRKSGTISGCGGSGFSSLGKDG